MIACTPIHPKIRNKLNAKMEVLGRTTPPANTETSKDKLKSEDVFTKSTFIRMTSNIAAPNKPIILMGGELRDETDINLTTIPMAPQFGFAKTYGEQFILKNDDPFSEGYNPTVEVLNKHKRPLPGIKSLSIEYYGGLKTNRRGTVSWVCWSFDDLERLKSHFLKHGRHVLIEWGWSNNLKTMNTALHIDPRGDYRINPEAVGGNIQKTIIDNEGDYDLMTGVISNFEWKTNTQGGFDCTTDIVGLGTSMLENVKKESKLTPISKVVNKNWFKRIWTSEDKEAVVDIDVDEIYKHNASLTMGSVINILDKKLRNYHLTGGSVTKKFSSLTMPGVVSYKKDTIFIAQILPQWENIFIKSTGIGLSIPGLPITALEVTDAWVTWGWFEDNVLNKFLSMANDTEAVTTFRSIEAKINEDGTSEYDEDGNLQYESVKIRSHDNLLTQNVHRFIFPGLYPDSHTLGTWEKYEKLCTIVEENLKPFHTGQDTGFQQKGYLRNILINVEILKEIFSTGSTGSLREAMERLGDELNQEYNIWDFQVKSDEINQDNSKMIDNNVTLKRIDRLMDNPEDIFLFPTWRHNSFVKSVDMQSTVPSSMVLATMYGANVPVESVLGGSDPGVDKKGFFLGGLSKDGTVDERFKNLENPFRKGLSYDEGTDDSSQWKRFGNEEADPNKPIAKGKGIDLSLTSEEIVEGLQEQLQKLIDDDPEVKKEVEEANEKFQKGYEDSEDVDPIPFTAWKWEKTGKKQPLYKDGIIRGVYLQGLTDVLQGITGPTNTTDILIPIELTMSIEGIGGIFPGNVFRTAYIPVSYFDKTVFQLVEVNHEIGSDGWTVSLKGIMRMSYIKRYGKVYEEMLEELRKMEKGGEKVWLASQKDKRTKMEEVHLAIVHKEEGEFFESVGKLGKEIGDIFEADSMGDAVDEAMEAFNQSGTVIVEATEAAVANVKHAYVWWKNRITDWWNK